MTSLATSRAAALAAAAFLLAGSSLLVSTHGLPVAANGQQEARGGVPQATQAPASQVPVYKGGVDLVRVDAYVVDKDGRPVPGLAPKDFQVTVDGKARTVVSADFVKLTAPRTAPGESGTSDAAPIPGRKYVLVVDQNNIQPGGLRVAVEAAQRFLKQLIPEDQVALLVVPAGGDSRFTTDHAGVSRRLSTLGGVGTNLRSEVFAQISIAESLQLEQVTPEACSPGGRVPPMLVEILERNSCLNATMGEAERSTCCQQIVAEIRHQVMAIQQATSQSLMALESLFRDLARVEGRKTVVLFSQRLVTASGAGSLDRRNDLRNAGRLAGPANANLYVLHLSKGLFEGIEVDVRQSAARPFVDETAARDGLEQIAGAAGGTIFQVVAGADFVFERIARETSAYYLLGLEPLVEDRDGKPHQIRVRTVLSGATVRARTEFVIPTAAAATAAQAKAAEPTAKPVEATTTKAPAAAPAEPSAPVAAAPPAPVLPPFERAEVLRPELTTFFLGRLEASAGDPSPALKGALDAARKGRFDELLDGLAASPDDAAARVLWGLALMTRGDLDAAGEEFRAALAIDPELSPAQFYTGAWHAARGNDAEAVRAWQAVVATEFDQPAVFEVLIDALLRVGQVGRAGALVEEARNQWRDDRLTPRAAAVAVASGDLRGALDMLTPYLEKHPGDVRTLALAMRAIAYTHAKGATVFDPATDKERVARFAQMYEKAGGADKAAVAAWVAAVK